MMDEQVGTGRSGGGAAGKGERKRRLTEEQTRSLESMFQAHPAKLEPREKAERARELGLQSRQVAIWFQNKRASWRSKQLEQDYADLRDKYDALHARVEKLRQEKLALTAQLHELSARETDLRNDMLWCADDMEPPESCVLGGACMTPVDVLVESDCGDHRRLDYDEGFPESLCATLDLWEPWPLVE